MEIVANDEAVRETLELLRQEYIGDGRTGLSLSTVIYCLTKAWKDKHEPTQLTDRELELFSIGFGLERVLIRSRMVNKQWELDGISMHPDLLQLSGVLADLKSTRARPDPPRMDTYGGMWIRQFLGYCKAEIEQKRAADEEVEFPYPFDVITVHLIQPVIKAWRYWFTEEEIEANWQYVLFRKQVHEMHQDMDEPPEPFMFMEQWECGIGSQNQCRHLLGCQLYASLKKANQW